MDVFAETTGVSVDFLSNFIQWVLTFSVVLFSAVVIRGSYARWVEGDMTAVDVIIDVSVAMAITVYIGILVN